MDGASMGSKAQLTQSRSRARRDELLAAAIELFAEGGSRAITHRAVAARADLPPASTTYYFATIDDLIREALGAHIDQWTADLTDLTRVEFEADVGINDAAAFVTAIFAARGPEVAALELSIFLASARVPELRDNAADAMRAFESLTIAILERVGVSDGAALAAAIVALIAGTALRRQSGLYSEPSEALLLTSAIRDLVAAHVLGPETVDRTLADLRRARA
jgi:DNA-binding transcriptional regulator YbjK